MVVIIKDSLACWSDHTEETASRHLSPEKESDLHEAITLWKRIIPVHVHVLHVDVSFDIFVVTCKFILKEAISENCGSCTGDKCH